MYGAQRVEPVQLPEVNLYHFENAIISVLSSSIIVGTKIIIERVVGDSVKNHSAIDYLIQKEHES